MRQIYHQRKYWMLWAQMWIRQPGIPYFPQAVCSRMSTGYVLMFRHLQAKDLENICEQSFAKAAKQFEDTYQIKVVGEKSIFTSLLLPREVSRMPGTCPQKQETFCGMSCAKCLNCLQKK